MENITFFTILWCFLRNDENNGGNDWISSSNRNRNYCHFFVSNDIFIEQGDSFPTVSLSKNDKLTAMQEI